MCENGHASCCFSHLRETAERLRNRLQHLRCFSRLSNDGRYVDSLAFSIYCRIVDGPLIAGDDHALHRELFTYTVCGGE